MKIDGQLTHNLLHNPLNRVSLRCFRDLAASVGAETIVESVEHDLQRDALLTLGFGLAQGYLLHKPDLLARLAANGSTIDAVADVAHAAVINSGTRAPLLGQLA